MLNVDDLEEPAKLLRRSLARLELEMLDLRVATPQKLRECVRRRRDRNRETFVLLSSNEHWHAQPLADLRLETGDIDDIQIRQRLTIDHPFFLVYFQALRCQLETPASATCTYIH